MVNKNILSDSDRQEIVKAIALAEETTSGEIHVHIESDNKKPARERAEELFFELGINTTQLQNGVLFFVCVQSKTLTVVGDEGINKKVAPDFWDEIKNNVLEHFKKGQFKKGLVLGIEQAGKQLQQFFPRTEENKNELANEISTQ